MEMGNNWYENIEGLDIEQGILYCGNMEIYVDILRTYCEEWEGNRAPAIEYFEKRDWKNYAIAVHGLKSALASIGAAALSAMAKELEFAGKEERISYIEEHHETFMDAYEAFFAQLLKNEYLCPQQEADTEDEVLPEITEDEWNRILSMMEEAVYSFDNELLIKYVDKLEYYSYKGNTLKKVLAPVRRKIEKYDCISAVEMLVEWKKNQV